MKELILHIGATKTGSSAIQHFFMQNRVALERLGILYPNVGIAGDAHHLFAAAIHPMAWRMHSTSFAEKDRSVYFAEYVDEIKRAAADSSANRIVLSSEYFWGFYPDAFFAPLQELVRSFDVRLLCYVRRQDEWLESTYAQRVKSGDILPFREWLLRHLDVDRPGFCSYDRILRQWELLVPPKRIFVRVYEAQAGVTDSVADVLDYLGITSRDSLAIPASKSNPSPLPDETEMIRLVNVSGLSEEKKRVLRKILLTSSQKKSPHVPFRYLSADETIQLMTRYEKGNALVARRYLGKKEGSLFAQPCPLPGEWPAWQGPSVQECAVRLLDLSSQLVGSLPAPADSDCG
jgi:capsular polysaccharide export protein